MSKPAGRVKANTSTRAKSQGKRAAWAWQKVEDVQKNDRDYLTEVRKLPARLLTNGLGQTMAFLYAKAKGNEKGDAAKQRLYAQLAERVRAFKPATSNDDPMRIIVGLDPVEYRVLSRELLETAEWLKRFAEGHIDAKAEPPAEVVG